MGRLHDSVSFVSENLMSFDVFGTKYVSERDARTLAANSLGL